MSARADHTDKIDRLLDLLTTRRQQPVYLRIIEGEGGRLEFEQVEFLTTQEFASLARVEPRTVYSWIEKGIGPRWFQPEGTGTKLCDLNDAVDWIRSQGAYERAKDN